MREVVWVFGNVKRRKWRCVVEVVEEERQRRGIVRDMGDFKFRNL
jgi:hypothetical protein